VSRVVCDASAIVQVLLDVGPDGAWAFEHLHGAELAAPDLLPWETSNVIRRHEREGRVSADNAVQAHADLAALRIELWPHELLASRAWQLRHNLTIYDAGYVALAERLDVPLITLDARIAQVPGIRCKVANP
jgi:predicted nucleic acid-binding protein